ncbi:MAG: heavy-metal-associated domain-containing protein [Usitatibacter sp.]
MIELNVPDMTCNHCASTITRAVKEVDGAVRCEIDLAAKRVRIDSAKPASEFVAAVAEAGYTPTLVR